MNKFINAKKIFIAVHFTLVLIISIGSFDQIIEYKWYKVPAQICNKMIYTEPLQFYSFLSGINTGYGFYGKQVATKKFFSIVAKSPHGEEREVSDLNLSFRGNQERIDGLAQYLANKIADHEDKKDTSVFSQKLTDKSLKYIGKYILSVNFSNIDSLEFKTRINQLAIGNVWDPNRKSLIAYYESRYFK